MELNQPQTETQEGFNPLQRGMSIPSMGGAAEAVATILGFNPLQRGMSIPSGRGPADKGRDQCFNPLQRGMSIPSKRL